MSSESYQRQYQSSDRSRGSNDVRVRRSDQAYGRGDYRTPMPEVPEVVLLGKDGTVNPDVVDSTAAACAKAFVANSRDGIKASQLRRFYADVKALELRAENGPFAAILPQVKLLKAKVAYAKARALVPEGFRQWLTDCADKVHDEKTFKAFLLHFEAVVGFCYGNGLKDNG